MISNHITVFYTSLILSFLQADMFGSSAYGPDAELIGPAHLVLMAVVLNIFEAPESGKFWRRFLQFALFFVNVLVAGLLWILVIGDFMMPLVGTREGFWEPILTIVLSIIVMQAVDKLLKNSVLIAAFRSK